MRTDSRALPRIADRGVLARLGTGFDVSGDSGPNTGFNDDFCETTLESQIQQSACCGHATVTSPSDGMKRTLSSVGFTSMPCGYPDNHTCDVVVLVRRAYERVD